jgi:hypothetical protein
MERMQFLKAFGATLGGSALLKPQAMARALSECAPATTPSARFRPGPRGQILVATAANGAWSVHTDFGPEFEVLGVRQAAVDTYAELRFQGMPPFSLQLDATGRHWKVQ